MLSIDECTYYEQFGTVIDLLLKHGYRNLTFRYSKGRVALGVRSNGELIGVVNTRKNLYIHLDD